MKELKLEDITVDTEYKQLSFEDILEMQSDQAIEKAKEKLSKSDPPKMEPVNPVNPFILIPDEVLKEREKDTKNQKKDEIIRKNIELIKRYKAGESFAFYEYIEANEPLIVTIANAACYQKYSSVEFDDVHNMIILIKFQVLNKMIEKGYAMDNSYDFNKFRMETISTLKMELAENYSDSGVYVPYSTQKQRRSIGKEIQETSVVDMTKKKDGSEYDSDSLLDIVTGGTGESTEDLYLQNYNTLNVKSAMCQLPEIERIVVEYRYGFRGDKESRKRKNIAKMLGESETHILSIEKRAIKHLKQYLN